MLTSTLPDGAEMRALEPWRAGEFAAHIERHRAHLAPWIPWATSITDIDGARCWLQAYADRQAADTGRIYGIWLDGVLVGGALFRVFDADAGVCEIGVWSAPDVQGRGLITKAAQTMIDWAIRERGIARVEWRTVPDNVRSKAVARRLGMTRDGVLREAFELNGTRSDVEVWSLLASDHRQEAGDPPPTERRTETNERPAAERPAAANEPPAGYHTVTPRMVVGDAAGAVRFLRAAFGATGDAPDGRPAEIRIGDSLVMVTQAGVREPFPALLYVYVADADATYRDALAAGAVSIEEPMDTPYGDRRAMVRDPYGNVFQIAHRPAAPA
jgi:ribosomal-protein-serine acetyltransferase